MNAELTAAQQRALRLLRTAPLHRSRFSTAWVAKDGTRIALAVVSSLRRRGLVSVTRSTQHLTARINDGDFDVEVIVSLCIGCGCDDMHACEGGCSWVRVDREKKRGVCSECTSYVRAFDAGLRKLSIEAQQNVQVRKELGAP